MFYQSTVRMKQLDSGKFTSLEHSKYFIDDSEGVDTSRYRDLLFIRINEPNVPSSDPLIQSISQSTQGNTRSNGIYNLKLEQIENDIASRFGAQVDSDIINLIIIYVGVALKTGNKEVLQSKIDRIGERLSKDINFVKDISNLLSGLSYYNTSQPKRKLVKMLNSLINEFPKINTLLNAKKLLLDSRNAFDLTKSMHLIVKPFEEQVENPKKHKYDILRQPFLLSCYDKNYRGSASGSYDQSIYKQLSSSLSKQLINDHTLNDNEITKKMKYGVLHNPHSYNQIKIALKTQKNHNSSENMQSYHDLADKQSRIINNQKEKPNGLLSGLEAWQKYFLSEYLVTEILWINAYGLFNRKQLKLSNEQIHKIAKNVNLLVRD